jgi:hypothetical protein
LARRCGELGHEACARAFDAEFMGKDLPYWNRVTELWDHFLARVGLTWDQLKEISPFEFMAKEDWKTYYVYKQIDPATGLPRGFNTPSKKIELYLESMITLGPHRPAFSAPAIYAPLAIIIPLPLFSRAFGKPAGKDGWPRRFPGDTSGRVRCTTIIQCATYPDAWSCVRS